MIQFGLMNRGQFPVGGDDAQHWQEMLEQVRWAEKLGFSSIMKGSHYTTHPLSEFQQIPFLSRIMDEAPSLRLIAGVVLLPLHKPLDIAEQLANIDVMSGGRLIFGVGIRYREVEFKAFGTTYKDSGPRLEENLEAIKRLWTEDKVSMIGSHFELIDAVCTIKPTQKPLPPIWTGANATVRSLIWPGKMRCVGMMQGHGTGRHRHTGVIAKPTVNAFAQANELVGLWIFDMLYRALPMHPLNHAHTTRCFRRIG